MMRSNRLILWLVVLILQITPFLLALTRWQPDYVFGGFLLNPLDGVTYLSKLQEGWSGSWKFSLLYSAQATEGGYLYLFYLFMGHLGRVFDVPLLWVLHVARVLAVAALLAALGFMCDRFFDQDRRSADRALWLAALGSGVGWIGLLITGEPSTDMWVAENYPFLSALTNVHFPLGLAIMMWMIGLDWGKTRITGRVVLAVLGVLLAVIQPFGLVFVAIALSGGVLYSFWRERRFLPWNLAAGVVPGGVYLLYQVWIINVDPVLAAWTRQNQTPAPAFGDFLLSMSPALLLAVFGGYAIWKTGKTRSGFSLVAWLAAGVILVYLPLSLQRRFMTGLYVPAALLAVVGANWIAGRIRRFQSSFLWLFGISVLTNILLLVVLVQTPAQARRDDPTSPVLDSVYFSRKMMDCLLWLRDETPPGSVVLADIQSGIFVPAWSGRRVVFGHLFETPNAEEQKVKVERFYSSEMTPEEVTHFLQQNSVDYILYKNQAPPSGGKIIFDNDGVWVVEVQK
jgi:hypothetical protein